MADAGINGLTALTLHQARQCHTALNRLGEEMGKLETLLQGGLATEDQRKEVGVQAMITLITVMGIDLNDFVLAVGELAKSIAPRKESTPNPLSDTSVLWKN